MFRKARHLLFVYLAGHTAIQSVMAPQSFDSQKQGKLDLYKGCNYPPILAPAMPNIYEVKINSINEATDTPEFAELIAKSEISIHNFAHLVQDGASLEMFKSAVRINDVNQKDDYGKAPLNILVERILNMDHTHSLSRYAIYHILHAVDFLLANGADLNQLYDVKDTKDLLDVAKNNYKKLYFFIEVLWQKKRHLIPHVFQDLTNPKHLNALTYDALQRLIKMAQRIQVLEAQCETQINHNISPMYSPLIIGDSHDDHATNYFLSSIYEDLKRYGVSNVCLELPDDIQTRRFVEHLANKEYWKLAFEDTLMPRIESVSANGFTIHHIDIVETLDNVSQEIHSATDSLFGALFGVKLRDKGMQLHALRLAFQTNGKLVISVGRLHVPSLVSMFVANNVSALTVFPHELEITDKNTTEGLITTSSRLDKLFDDEKVFGLHLPKDDLKRSQRNLEKFKQRLDEEYNKSICKSPVKYQY